MRRELTALVRSADDEIRALCPLPGAFRARVAPGDLVRPGAVLGELETLAVVHVVVAPDGARGIVTHVAALDAAVAYGEVLVSLDPRGETASGAAGPRAGAAPGAATAAATGLVFRAPTSGRFYGRPSPDKPAFTEPGTELAPGATICLLEVMKTFHRVTYAAAGGLPARARVTAVLVADGADVNAGDPLLSIE